jgi:hypothetical protein
MNYMFGATHGLPNLDVFGPDAMDTTSDRDIDFGDGDYDIDVGLGLTAPAQGQDDDASLQDAPEGEWDERDPDEIMTDEDDTINYGDEAVAQTTSTGNASGSYTVMPPFQTAASSYTVMSQTQTAASGPNVTPQAQLTTSGNASSGNTSSGTMVTAQARLATSGNASSGNAVTPPAQKPLPTPMSENDLIDYSDEEDEAYIDVAPQNHSSVPFHQTGSARGTVSDGAQALTESALGRQPTYVTATGSEHAASSEHAEENHDQYDEDNDAAAQEAYDEDNDDAAQEPYDQQDEDATAEQAEQAEAGSRFCRGRPVTINYDGNDLWLFRDHDRDGSGDYLLEDSSLVHSSISEFFQACRSALGEDISNQTELGLEFDDLHNLVLYEDNTACVAVSLERLLTLYYTLHAQDGLIDPDSFYMRLLSRPRFAALLSDLVTHADQSRGFSGLDASIAAGETHFVNTQSGSSTEHEGTDWDHDENDWTQPIESPNDAEHQPESEVAAEEEHEQETFESNDGNGDGETEHQPEAEVATEEEHEQETFESNDGNGDGEIDHQPEAEVATEEDHEQETFESNDGNGDGESEHQPEAEVATEEDHEQETFESNDGNGDGETEHQPEAEVAPGEDLEQETFESNDGNGDGEIEQSAQDHHDADETARAHIDNEQQALHTPDSVGFAASASSHQADAAAPEVSHEQPEEYDLIDYSDDDLEEDEVKQTLLANGPSASSSTVQGDEPALGEVSTRSAGSPTPFQDGPSTNQAAESEYQDYTNEEFTAYEYQGLDQQEPTDSTAVVDGYTGGDDFLDLTTLNDGEDVIPDIDFGDEEEDGAVEQPAVAASSAADPVATSSNGLQYQSPLSPQGQKRSIDEVGDSVDNAPDSTGTFD